MLVYQMLEAIQKREQSGRRDVCATLGGSYLRRTEMPLCSHVTFFQKTLVFQKYDVASNYYLVKELNEKSTYLDNK